ncbi:MAG: hypothetical protein Q6373_011330 [Candidatus Sigynarchaeota archaeon]
MNTLKVDLAVKLKKDEKEKEKEPEPKKEEKPEAKKSDSDKFDLITIVSSVEMDIPEKEPPYSDILYDFIPESEQRVIANKDDHVSKKAT